MNIPWKKISEDGMPCGEAFYIVSDGMNKTVATIGSDKKFEIMYQPDNLLQGEITYWVEVNDILTNDERL